MEDIEYYTLFAIVYGKKTKIGYGYFDEKTGELKIKADSHSNKSVIGGALMAGKISIGKRQQQNTWDTYECAADEFENDHTPNSIPPHVSAFKI